jgi:two-component system, chemotaxis family, sensor kinase CheA
MNEFVSQFLLEARELTEQGTRDLLALEQKPSDSASLDGAFRALHTLKGAAAIMEYAPMERMLHRTEDMLQRLRAGSATVSPAIIDACLASIGQTISWLDVIESEGELPADAEEAASRVLRQLDGHADRPVQPAREWITDFMVWAGLNGGDGRRADQCAIRYAPPVDVFFTGVDPLALVERLPGLAAVRIRPAGPWPGLADMQPFDCNLVIEALSSATPAQIEHTLGALPVGFEIVSAPVDMTSRPNSSDAVARSLIESQVDFVRTSRSPEAFAGALGSAGRLVGNVLRSTGRSDEVGLVEKSVAGALADGAPDKFVDAVTLVLNALRSTSPAANVADQQEIRRETGASGIRVEIEKVDAIVDLTGELLVVKNALAHLSRVAAEGADAATLAAGLRTQTARLDRHVIDLQRAVLDLRVLPMSRVFNRFPVLVRDVAAKLGKQVVFRSEGGDTVADKAVVEALFEPLLHAVRNAIDHGVEQPEDRRAAGKPLAASVLMRAWRQGDRVVVEVSDDGRGVDTSVVRRLAVERGLDSAEEVAALTEAETVDLIFAPGFTTAAEVTDLSGRGVGMNAVRAAVERIGGEVGVTNTPGAGLVVRFSLPFTVMMTRVMTVEAAGQIFGLPFDAILETVRLPRSQIKALGAGEALVLRDTTIPVLDLAACLELDVKQEPRPAVACLVIASVGSQRVGIEIERPGERLDLMLKPVEGLLADIKAIAGTSLLGDGRVLIVLDLGALFG